MSGARRLLQTVLPPVVACGVLIAVWQGAVIGFAIKSYVLPGPLDVATAAVRRWDELARATWLTGRVAICGFGLSLAVGSTASVLFAEFVWLRRGVLPYAVFLQTVPIVAVAPLIINWLGPGFASIVLVSFVVSLFPIIANATAGLTAIEPPLWDMFRLYGATRWQTIARLRIPHAVPHLLTGARTSAGLSVIGAIVGEFFAGGYDARAVGLGFLIPQRIAWLRTDEAFAAVLAAAALGLLLFGAVGLVRQTVLARWCPPEIHERQ